MSTREPVAPDADSAATKGRATPKRTAARAERAKERKGGPQNRKERAAARREAMRAARSSLASTDPARLPARERVAELVYVRDLVDSRFHLGQVVVWLMVFTLVVGTVYPPVEIPIFVALLILCAVTIRDVHRIERAVGERFPASTVRVRFYAVRRIVSPRRMRRPVPRLSRGAEVR